MVEEEVQLKAGRATPLSLQCWNSLMTFSPVRTPAGTTPDSPVVPGMVREGVTVGLEGENGGNGLLGGVCVRDATCQSRSEFSSRKPGVTKIRFTRNFDICRIF